MSLLYSNYQKDYNKNTWYNYLVLDTAFSNKYPSGGLSTQLLVSITGCVKKNLHEAHNIVATDIKNEISLLDGCKIAAIELGLLSTALVIAPVETVIRAVIAAVFIPLAFIMHCFACLDDTDAENIYVLAGLGLAHTSLAIGETLVSAFYSHIAHYNKQINYIGHGNCHVLCEPPKDS